MPVRDDKWLEMKNDSELEVRWKVFWYILQLEIVYICNYEINDESIFFSREWLIFLG